MNKDGNKKIIVFGLLKTRNKEMNGSCRESSGFIVFPSGFCARRACLRWREKTGENVRHSYITKLQWETVFEYEVCIH